MAYEPSATARAIQQDAAKKVSDLDKECAKNRAQIADVLTNLKAAVAKKDGPMLNLYLKRVDPTSTLLVDTISDASKALAAVKKLEEADDGQFLEAKFEVVKALTEKVDKIKTNLSSQLVELKKLQKEALKAADGLQGGQDEAVETYAKLEDRVNDKKVALGKKHKDLKAQVAIADKAWDAKDQKKLTEARSKIIELHFSTEGIELDQLDRELADFIKKYKDAGLNTDAQWAKDEVYKLKGITDEGKAQEARLMKLGQIPKAPPPPAKPPAKLGSSQIAAIAKYFPIDAKDSKAIAKFGKILNEHPHVKWPEQLVKAFDWKKADVEAGMKKANQLPYVKDLYLIDI